MLLALVFIATGGSKLLGVPMMVTIFDHIGIGQWFRYVTGAIEITGAVMLLTQRFIGAGAILLAGTMAGAVLTHLLVLPESPAPAAVLLLLCTILAWIYRARTFALLGLDARAVA